MKNSLSEKELGFISKLELKGKYFFTRDDIKDNFKNANEMNVYIHRLKKKGRIIKLNKAKYYLVPIRAVRGRWSEYPYIMIDEMMNKKDYCIVGKAAAYYWKLIDQIPAVYEVYTTGRPKEVTIFNARIIFKRRRIKNFPKTTKRKIQGHEFIIATRQEAKEWI